MTPLDAYFSAAGKVKVVLRVPRGHWLVVTSRHGVIVGGMN